MPHPRFSFNHHRRPPLQKKDGGNQKFVVAHHMVGNTYPYTQDDWSADIEQAHAAGIDGFALNIGTDEWQPKQVASAYAAAQASGTDFKLFFSFDMSVIPCASPDDAATLRNYIKTYANHPNQLKYNGRSFASTFAGENCKFGQDTAVNGWKTQFVQHPELSGENAVYFVPSFFIDPATFKDYSGVMHGAFNFNSGWPISLTTQSANSDLSSVGANLFSSVKATIGTIVNTLEKFVGATDTDTQYINGLGTVNSDTGKPAYMAAVSPWFFTHYSPQTFNKNWIYYADSHLYPTRWENIVDKRDDFDLVEIVTWNDYGESHYIGDIKGAQPNSQAWVDGFDHTAWLDMTSYYATAYKTGKYPAIQTDKIYMWARPHTSDANAPDPVGKPDNFQLSQDILWAVVFATAPGTVTLHTSDSASQTFQVQPGVNKLSTQLTPGGYMRGVLERDGQTVIDLKPEGYSFTANPQAYNYNAFTAFAAAQ
ncbi:glycoside hydrolase [Irpex rosettiformis]|uniref:Glycoside hydrolase n=1 Tax=Irpex rosettiformis TaxID=378272 RepID=A0ACB8TWY0_9APHY|nr:glycoside hydrolase [Irpex rosettiformis]